MSNNPHSFKTLPFGPPLSVVELSEHCMGNAAVALLVLDKFEKQLATDIRELEDRLASQDTAQLARTAHALKGAAGAVAATILRELASRVEDLARQRQTESIAGALSVLHTEAERCLGYLPAARAALTNGTTTTEGGR